MRLLPTAIGPNGSKNDSETSHVAGVVTLTIMYPQFYRYFFHNGSVVVFSFV